VIFPIRIISSGGQPLATNQGGSIMRHVTDNVIYLNYKQARELLGEHTEPADIEYFDGIPARAERSRQDDGLYIILYRDLND